MKFITKASISQCCFTYIPTKNGQLQCLYNFSITLFPQDNFKIIYSHKPIHERYREKDKICGEMTTQIHVSVSTVVTDLNQSNDCHVIAICNHEFLFYDVSMSCIWYLLYFTWWMSLKYNVACNRINLSVEVSWVRSNCPFSISCRDFIF